MEYERILHEIKTTSLEGTRSKEVRGNNGKQKVVFITEQIAINLKEMGYPLGDDIVVIKHNHKHL